MAHCSVDGCDRTTLHTRRGYCAMHYERWRQGQRGDDFLRPAGTHRNRISTCTIDGCDRTHASRGMCTLHYNRWRNGKDLLAPAKSDIRQVKGCAVEGCERDHTGKTLCQKHYNLFKGRQRMRTLIRLKGGSCERCGFGGSPASFDFHHRDSATKSFALEATNMSLAWDRLVAESEKCELLCANCHRLEHSHEEDEDFYGPVNLIGAIDTQDEEE